jgi:hypothetical protein
VDLDRPRDLGRILDDAFSLYRRAYPTLLLVAVVVIVPLQLLVFGVGLGWLTGAYRTTQTTTGLVAGLLQALIAAPLVTAMTVHVVREAAAGRDESAGVALRAGLEVLPRLLPAIALVLLGVSVGSLLIIPGIILAIRWALVPQVVVVEGAHGTGALARSAALVSGRGWFTFVVILVTTLIVGALGQIVLVPLDAAAKSGGHQWPVLIGQTVSQLFAIPLQGIATTLLYFSLRAEKEGGRAAPPAVTPAPDAPAGPETEAWDRRRAEGWQPPA